MYLVTALLHPQEFTMIIYGLMYFICIPSGYLLLTIYSLVNMNNVSWGTRETNKAKETEKRQGILCDRTCKLCCWDMSCQVTQDTEIPLLQQFQQAVVSTTGTGTTPAAGPNPQTTGEAAPRAVDAIDSATKPQSIMPVEENKYETELKPINSEKAKTPGVDRELQDHAYDSISDKRYLFQMRRVSFYCGLVLCIVIFLNGSCVFTSNVIRLRE